MRLASHFHVMDTGTISTIFWLIIFIGAAGAVFCIMFMARLLGAILKFRAIHDELITARNDRLLRLRELVFEPAPPRRLPR